jgi:Reverse transcriptase (RNA-dependent DNA polymerase)
VDETDGLPQPNPKADGIEVQSAASVAALEDKIVQRATVAVLNAIYEEDFLGFSYGFGAGRGPHDALDALVVGISSTKVNWILDADIRSFFDEVSQDWLVRFVKHRIGDPRMIRLIQKWLRAGILEDGVVTVSDKGTGQGSVASPLLANIYLHYVFDLWAKRWRGLGVLAVATSGQDRRTVSSTFSLQVCAAHRHRLRRGGGPIRHSRTIVRWGARDRIMRKARPIASAEQAAILEFERTRILSCPVYAGCAASQKDYCFV